MNSERQGSELVLSFMAQRRVIGVLGVCLPLVVMIGGWESSGHTVRDSISAYYHSNMRDFFVGLLAMTSIFLLSYRGHDTRDRVLTFLSGLFALGVATFPTIRIETGPDDEIEKAKHELLGVFGLPGDKSRIVHYACAVALFVCLTGMCYQFTQSRGTKTQQKNYRNVVYWICAGLMASAIVLAGIFMVSQLRRPADLILIVEAVCLGAFGVSWLVKGETILSDEGSVATRVGRAWRGSRLYQMLSKPPPEGASSP